MKFDFIIGNPPYNDEFGGTGDNKTYAAPLSTFLFYNKHSERKPERLKRLK